MVWYYGQILAGNTDPVLIKDYIAVEALVMGVNPQMAQVVARRESEFNCTAKGDGGKSHGCWQIHLGWHPEITKEQARNIIWSTQWSLAEMKVNGCKAWSTCRDTMKEIASVGP